MIDPSPDEVERVAKAIEDQMASDDNMPTDIARAAIAAMPGWRPIETAPAEKTLIGWNTLWSDPGLIWKAFDGHSWKEGPCGDFFDFGFEPTHWMPLPQPPEPTDE